MAHAISDHWRVSRAVLDRTARRMTAAVRCSSVLGWRLHRTQTGGFRMVPGYIHNADPTFFACCERGYLKIGAATYKVRNANPFALIPTSSSLDGEPGNTLRSFAWADDLRAAGHGDAESMLVAWTGHWLSDRKRIERKPAGPQIVRRRLRALLTHADLILQDADADRFDDVLCAILDDVQTLSQTWRNCDCRADQLRALMTLVLAGLTLEYQDAVVERFEPMLSQAIRAQIQPDGGHISRNAGTVLDVLAELLPLLRAYPYAERTPPEALAQARAAMQSFLRTMRLGDQQLARFNGSDTADIGLLAMTVKMDPEAAALPHASDTGYARLTAGKTILITDIGPTPATASKSSHAGCLSFEMSYDDDLIFTNAVGTRRDGRSNGDTLCHTGAHNTLMIANAASADPAYGGIPPDGVFAQIDSGAAHTLTAEHTGYLSRFGLKHRRTLTLNHDGNRLTGTDRIDGGSATDAVRFKSDVPFSIHFHLGCDIAPTPTDEPGVVALTHRRSGRTWRFACDAAQLYIEDQPAAAASSAGTRRQQIVLRGATHGESTVIWTLALDDSSQSASICDPPN